MNDKIVCIVLGLVMFGIAYLIGVKQKIQILHSYHYKRIKDEDKKSFCTYTGIASCIIGIGLLLIPFIGEGMGMAIVFLGIAISLVVIMIYNKGLF